MATLREMNQCIDYNTAFRAEGGAQQLSAKHYSIQVCSVWFTVLLKFKLLFINKSANGWPLLFKSYFWNFLMHLSVSYRGDTVSGLWPNPHLPTRIKSCKIKKTKCRSLLRSRWQFTNSGETSCEVSCKQFPFHKSGPPTLIPSHKGWSPPLLLPGLWWGQWVWFMVLAILYGDISLATNRNQIIGQAFGT